MDFEENKRLTETFKQYYNEALSNSELFESKLLKTFPLKRDLNVEYLRPNTFYDEDDKEDYFAAKKILDDKDWQQVNLDELYSQYIQSLPLNPEGLNYYLPAFLKYFYDLRHGTLHWFDSIVGDLELGSVSTRYRIGEDGRSYLVPTDYSVFEKFTPAQSKLIAAFLVHVANLYDSNTAQNALNNYWGKFLLSADAS